MAPSMDIVVMEEEKKKRKKPKESPSVEEVIPATEDFPAKTKKKQKNNNDETENDSNAGDEEEAIFIQLIAKYLDKRNLHRTLTSFLSETRCKNSWKTQTKDLEDIYNQYSNQDSKNLKKLNIQVRVGEEKSHLSIDDRNNNPKFLKQEVQTKDANKVVNSKVALSSKGELKISGALKPQVSGSDNSVSSCDDAQNELAKSKNEKCKAPRKFIDLDSDKTPKQNSPKLEKSLKQSLEVINEEKKKKKKKKKKMNTKDKNLIDNDEHKTSTYKENGTSIKDNSESSKTSLKQTDCGKLKNSSQESLEVLTEEEEKKNKNSKDKDLMDNNEKKTSTDKSTPKTNLKKKDFGKLDKSLEEVLEMPKEKKKKRSFFEDNDLIDNNEEKTSIKKENINSIKDDRNPSKTSNKSKNILKMNESLQESVEVPKKRKKEHDAKEKDSGDNEKQISAEKNKKEKKELKKKLQSSGSNLTNAVATKNKLKDFAEDTDKSLVDNTPGQKVGKEEEQEANISSNTKQKSGEPTGAKAFQRVKVEEVQFVDPRLQDNSYWAKSGAEIGYGAKAEQVLGQVRGKDFRHEKTKKKRGSYKGGMIDLQSHSIKFSYSDEE